MVAAILNFCRHLGFTHSSLRIQVLVPFFRGEFGLFLILSVMVGCALIFED